ncbi:MAG: 30S ribosomal protein S7 [Candidatus Portnoybacteria bacterium RIFCSPLOWO2_01_FULL_43_11]|uniref:Small ribosomal subunit protein uS7 n=3 Tax=Candidatus Portnoyibacteriota TaxID=1817913 RepID=A0A1G2FB65_9BACT|nr:MAG: 30S ribosomal protein S7 [Candidatus Portnoybacteria bacterium RIFCSPHIGHO2_01_FULL_40_12b]OGZ37051.1 MAG: 30S ribosomal protein S7 [Candidatus Portnoybacteria bacterium RIFCSPHIGHO2_02_FULL_40_23]OGZ38871.1 MAG: 30S ribosomal protein S7 [Candidatus Portnoybacteria bacterium RIFCSPLOWO2_01_FULL_43_11]OGZ40515.1 MAG: 30S ribosomal protein S7 [Candidatus Portnoybacteria bacterium RIFCSPLOWO2_02_FULL_40_15]
MRRKRKIKRQIQSDPKYNNTLVAKFINHIMKEGKKSTAQRVVYGAFENIEKQIKKDPLEIFDQAVKNASPILEVKSRRIGGAHYQVPREVRGERRIALAFRWIIQAAKSKKGKPMSIKLAAELIEASQNQGAAIKKKQDTHRMAEANRAFAHFAW